MYAIYLQSKKSVRHLILLSLGTAVLNGCSQSHQLEKVPENQQPSQPTSTKNPATEVLDGASDTRQPNEILEDAPGVGETGNDVSGESGTDIYLDTNDADKSIYLGDTKGETAGLFGCLPKLWCF